MTKKFDDATREKLENLAKNEQIMPDDICQEIFFTLYAYKTQRFNELLRALQRLEVKITKPTLKEHLQHLIELKIVESEKSFQYTAYSLTKEYANEEYSVEYLKSWLEAIEKDPNLPPHLRPVKFDDKEYYNCLSEKQLDDETDEDLCSFFASMLFELKTFIDYDLRIGEYDDTKIFWNFVGNPIFRNREKMITDNCRDSERYKEKIFSKIDILVSELRPDKELLKKRAEKKSGKLK
jgi:DNA-binding HxlR family transcriptional regulator